ncbi:MAG TPA: 3-deoxy-7-phosphoheptulonate synthase [Candidatus Limnocylindrales bacterium]|nr:3-deoxy-7-phosphoheptulonate synthase [Candidatus Limnocylindrales bacterium]
MIIVMKTKAVMEEVENVEKHLIEMGFSPHRIQGVERLVIGAVGEEKLAFPTGLEALAGVERVVPISAPYKLVSRQVKEEDSIVKVGDLEIGGRQLVIMAGPCAVENLDQLLTIAHVVKASGAQVLRGGAFKPRSSPYSFRGLELEGLKMLDQARQETGLKVVTEVLDPHEVELVARYTDIIQVGARNMQNFSLLREVGRSGKPVLLKRGLSATIEEWLMAAEYVLTEDNFQVILCERGIRTFETATRSTLDISAIPLAKHLSHLPVIADPCHASGSWRLAAPLSQAAIAAGADGLLIEVHHKPAEALCDGPQSLTPENFFRLLAKVNPVATAVYRTTPYGDWLGWQGGNIHD